MLPKKPWPPESEAGQPPAFFTSSDAAHQHVLQLKEFLDAML
jgi:hypothetical protein